MTKFELLVLNFLSILTRKIVLGEDDAHLRHDARNMISEKSLYIREEEKKKLTLDKRIKKLKPITWDTTQKKLKKED